MTIQALQTAYRNHRFRSRLEARWAVFFDALGIPWQYEPQGYALPALTEHAACCFEVRVGKACYCLQDLGAYLPDFFLPTLYSDGAWFEVKGIEPTLLERAKLGRLGLLTDKWTLLAWGSMPAGDESDLGDSRDRSGIDTVDDINFWPTMCQCGEFSIEYEGRVERSCSLGRRCPAYYAASQPAWMSGPGHPRIRQAYAAARSARFEHGESGPAPRSTRLVSGERITFPKP